MFADDVDAFMRIEYQTDLSEWYSQASRRILLDWYTTDNVTGHTQCSRRTAIVACAGNTNAPLGVACAITTKTM